MHRLGSKWQDKDTGALCYQEHRWRVGLDKERKVKTKEDGDGKGKFWEGQRKGIETKGGQNTSILFLLEAGACA